MKYPTLQQYQTAIKYADNDDPANRDSSLLMNYLTYFANFNPRIKGHIKTREAAISSWSWMITAPDGTHLDVSMQLAQSISLIGRGVVAASLFGYWLAKIDWQFDPISNSWLPKIAPINLKFVEQIDESTFLHKQQNSRTVIPPDDMNYIRISDGTVVGGVMRSIGELEILRRDAIFEWGNYLRKLKGLIQGIDKGADDEERQVAANALRTAIENNYLLTSDMIDFKFHNIASTAGSSFKDFLEFINSAVSVAILGQANTTELPSKSGSRAALSVQKLITDDIMYSDIVTFEKVVNTQLLAFSNIVNYGTNHPAYRFKVILDESEDYEKNAIIIREAVSSGIPLKKIEVYEKLGLTPPQDGDDILQTTAGY